LGVKILHTSDWHLGRQFHGASLEADHEHVLSQVMDAMKLHDPDALIIAGDIFDRAAPPAEAVRQFNGFVRQVASETRAAIILIAGNHDSGDRIAALAALADRNRVLIEGPINASPEPLVLHDAHGPVAFSALPFSNEYAAGKAFGNGDIRLQADVVAAQVEAARARVPDGARWVIVGHVFVANASSSESERRIAVGGLETVPASHFHGAHYVALGHLHRPQPAGAPHIRYSGSPLMFGFDELDAPKTMTLVDLDASGVVSLDHIPFVPLRPVKVVEGSFRELIEAARASPSEDFIKIILNDRGDIIDPMGQFRAYYPNAMTLVFSRNDAADTAQWEAAGAGQAIDPRLLVEDFFGLVREDALDDAEQGVIDRAMSAVLHAEDLP
jgi:exonuclease SbcD